MSVKIIRLTPLSLAKVLSFMHMTVGLFIGFGVAMVSMMTQEDSGILALGPWSIIILPIMNAFIGFVSGLFLAGCYNLAVPWIGGIEVEHE